MKNLRMLLIFFFCGNLSAQPLQGAWKLTHKNGNKVTEKETIRIYQDGYFAFGTRETGTNGFIKAGGGEFFLDENYIETYDFHTGNKDIIGESKEYQFELKDDKLILLALSPREEKEVWQRISNEENELSGNWVITGRMQNGEISTMTPGDRRTIKILGGGRFQWVAFNSETKEFHGTGGGTYSAKNGKYIENIAFFSRDDSRVGAELQFDYEIKEGKWHHRGESSTGNPIYEIWSSYAVAYED